MAEPWETKQASAAAANSSPSAHHLALWLCSRSLLFFSLSLSALRLRCLYLQMLTPLRLTALSTSSTKFGRRTRLTCKKAGQDRQWTENGEIIGNSRSDRQPRQKGGRCACARGPFQKTAGYKSCAGGLFRDGFYRPRFLLAWFSLELGLHFFFFSLLMSRSSPYHPGTTSSLRMPWNGPV